MVLHFVHQLGTFREAYIYIAHGMRLAGYLPSAKGRAVDVSALDTLSPASLKLKMLLCRALDVQRYRVRQTHLAIWEKEDISC